MKLLLLVAANFYLAYSVPVSGGIGHQDVLMNSPAARKLIPPPCDHFITTDPVHQTMQALVKFDVWHLEGSLTLFQRHPLCCYELL